jgi:pyruvate dehydrogenase E2 component (dihydrolipoamide acetyltransferase)
MVQALRMPMMGNTMETGLLAEWLVGEGDPVEADQVVAVVESEKAAADVVANRDGTLVRVDVAEGEEVPPGTLIGVVVGPGEDVADAPPPRSRIEPGVTGGQGREGGDDGASPASTERGTPEGSTAAAGAGDGPEPRGAGAEARSNARRVRAAPGARRLADEAGVDLDAVEGSGPDGAVLIADVEGHLERVDERPDGERVASNDDEQVTPTPERGRAFVPPSTRRLARELGVDLERVEGTGSGGRVTESDVRQAAAIGDVGGGVRDRSQATPADGTGPVGIAGPPPRDPSRFGVTVREERELSGVRRTVAERMSRSARAAPQVTLNREVSVERAFETVEELSDATGAGADDDRTGNAEVGFVDMLVGAAVRALERHPEFNAWYEGESHRLIEEANVAIAVDAETGLLAPVVREAGRRTLAGIARERRGLTDLVLEGRHGLDDLQGATFTVSNLGPLGVDSFDPILDPPQVAILGVGRAVEGTCTLSLTFDHRVVDGADAARFLDTLVGGLEHPSVVVAERAAAGAGVVDRGGPEGEPDTAPGSEPEPGRPATKADSDAVEAAVAGDLIERAREVAAAHDWPVPEFEVRLDGERPTVTVTTNGDVSPATLRRLTYAACRESRYADTVAGLRDPDLELRQGGPGAGDERD